jgi:hypothetical protein
MHASVYSHSQQKVTLTTERERPVPQLVFAFVYVTINLQTRLKNGFSWGMAR